MFFEFLSRLLALDFAWIAGLLLGNLHWIFFFYVLMYIFMEGKKVWMGFIVIILVMWLWNDFGTLTGVSIFVAAFMALYYISKLAVVAIAENSPGLKKRMFIVSEFQAITSILIFIIFMSGG